MTEQVKPHWKIYLWIAVILAAMIFVVLGVNRASHSSDLAIKTVKVEGVSSTYQQQVKQAVQPYLDQGLLTVRLKNMQQALEAFDWVATAELRRVWPNELLIVIRPQDLVAFWNQNGVLNRYAEVFPVGELTTHATLPTLTGAENAQVKVLGMFQQADNLLSPLHLKITKLQWNTDKTWQLSLNNGMNLQLGQHQALVGLRRFVKVYPEVFASHRLQAKNVDLRYPDGMAVRWGKS
jgi:cell division protein FtsQ